MSSVILVVDDNPTNLKLAQVTLRSAGFDVRTAEDATNALEVLKQVRPALILMDLQMPGMDGLTLTRLLKSNQETKAIPVVALTAYAMRGDEEKALAAGCAGYIVKPIDTRTLPDLVRGYIEEAGMEGAHP